MEHSAIGGKEDFGTGLGSVAKPSLARGKPSAQTLLHTQVGQQRKEKSEGQSLHKETYHRKRHAYDEGHPSKIIG